MIINIFFNNINFIIIDIALCSIMAFIGILTFGKTKKLIYLFFILSALFLYILMIFRVLNKLNIFNISQITLFDIPLIEYIIIYMPHVLIIIGFLLILKEK